LPVFLSTDTAQKRVDRRHDGVDVEEGRDVVLARERQKLAA
jgi:hypothetical protein